MEIVSFVVSLLFRLLISIQGTLEIKQAVLPGLLHLILGLTAVRYRKAKQERD